LQAGIQFSIRFWIPQQVRNDKRIFEIATAFGLAITALMNREFLCGDCGLAKADAAVIGGEMLVEIY
jgi:hypothetical protein